jgi:outer membrane receptor protein involved in Fe transport
MSNILIQPRRVASTAIFLIAASFTPSLLAQTAPAPEPAKPVAPAGAAKPKPAPAPATPTRTSTSTTSDLDKRDVVELSPFEVRADQDNSYNALETNSITRFRTELYKLPVTAEVFTEAFMRDVAATNVEEMVMTYGGATVVSQNFTDTSFNNQPGDRVGSLGTPTNMNIRGLPASVHRDGFLSISPTSYGRSQQTDNFSIERVDVTSGAHSLLYGDSGGGGVINSVSKQGRFNRNFARIDYRIDQYGSKRGNLDVGVGGKYVAARVDIMTNDQKYRRVNLGGTTNGIYAQLAFKLPFNTILRLSQQDTISFVQTGSGNGNINNFFYQRDASGAYKLTYDSTGKVVTAKYPDGTDTGVPLYTVDSTDSRRNLNLDYLIASGQGGNLQDVLGPVLLNLRNSDSFKGWTAGNWNHGDYSLATLETSINRWLSTQFAVAYDDAVNDAPTTAGGLTPAAGQVGSGSNPFPYVAIAHTNPGDSLGHTRVAGFRWSLLANNEFFDGKVHSTTLLGGEGTHRTGAQNGVEYRYYLLNPDGSLYVNQSALNNGEYGRIKLAGSPTLWVPVQNGMVSEPFYRPMSPTIQAINTVANTPGVGTMTTWVRQQRRRLDPALITPTNMLGADRTGSGEYNIGHTATHAYNAANVTEWFGGRLETLAGARYVSEYDLNIGPTAMTALPKTNKLTYSAGINYAIFPWLRVFSDISSAYNPSAQPNDPLGTAVLPPAGSAATPDVGIKFRLFDDKINGTITYAPKNTIKNDRINIDGSYFSAINPAGINGRYLGTGGTAQGTVNNDKKSTDFDASITFSLHRNWRARLGFHMVDGSLAKTVSYRQVYNDQFYTDSTGTVTYGAGGPPILVNTTTGKVVTTGGVPLTLGLINTQSSVFWANPAPDSGAIQSSALKTALTTVGPNGATANTNVTGLPLSAIQYTWGDPNQHNGVIMPIIAGDKTTGYAHYTFSFTNRYEFDRTFLRGLAIITTVNAAYQFRSHYYPVYGPGQTPGTTPFNQLSRKLYVRPTIATVDLGLSYSHKIGKRYTWTTQVNIQNALNHYRYLFLPASSSANPTVNNYIPTTEPRLWIWTNSIAF